MNTQRSSMIVTGVCIAAFGGTTHSATEPCVEQLVVEASPDPAEAVTATLRDVVVIAPDDIWAAGSYEPPSRDESFSLVVHFDGTEWSIVDSPSPPNPKGKAEISVEDIDAVASDLVYAAGSYSGATLSAPDTFVMRWDGSGWEHVPSPGVSGFGAHGFLFEAVEAIDEENVWFGGQFQDVGAPDATMVRYDGSDFDVHYLPRDPTITTGAHRIRAIDALAPDDVWAAGSAGGIAVAVGSSYVAHWNGSSWTHVPTPELGFGEIVRDIAAIASDDVWICGSYQIPPPGGGAVITLPLFLHWDGSGWTQFESPAFAQDLVAMASDDIYGVNGDDLLHFDGSAWSVIDTLEAPPGVLVSLSGVDAVHDCDIVAVGVTIVSVGDMDPLVARGVGLEIEADLDGDGAVGFSDLLILLAAWGPCDPPPAECAADIDDDGVVGFGDLLILLASWSA